MKNNMILMYMALLKQKGNNSNGIFYYHCMT